MKQPTEYQLWKEGHKTTMLAYTEEQVFNFGFEAGVLSQFEAEKEVTKEQRQALDDLYESTKELEELIEEPKIPKNSKKK